MVNLDNNIENIQYMEYGSDAFGTSDFGGQTSATGNLNISSTPSGARIWLAPSGQTLVDQGIDTVPGGQLITGLDIGDYDIKLVLIDYIDWTTTTSVSAGSTTDVVATLTLALCPTSARYSGDDITLQSTPRDGIGPYYVVFRKDGDDISPSRLGGLDNPILNAPENVQITRVYTLNDLDISSASTGTIDFSVYIEDSCPTGPMSCTETCTINIGCVAPVCNFTVT
jgi:hypothetical protein